MESTRQTSQRRGLSPHVVPDGDTGLYELLTLALTSLQLARRDG